jgi:hypothetical protein
MVRIEATLTIGSGGSTNPTLVQDAARRLLKKIGLIYGGRQMQELNARRAHLRGAGLEGADLPSTTPGSTAPGSYTIHAVFPLYFAPPDQPNPLVAAAAYLAANAEVNPILTYECGVVTDLYTGGDRTVTLENVKAELFGELVGGDFAPQKFVQIKEREKAVTIAQEGFRIDVDPGPGINLRNVTFESRLAGARSNAVVSTIELIADQNTSLGKTTFEELRRIWRKRSGRELDAGIAIWDLDETGDWNGNLKLGQFSLLRFEMKVAAPSGDTAVVMIPETYQDVQAS